MSDDTAKPIAIAGGVAAVALFDLLIDKGVITQSEALEVLARATGELHMTTSFATPDTTAAVGFLYEMIARLSK